MQEKQKNFPSIIVIERTSGGAFIQEVSSKRGIKVSKTAIHDKRYLYKDNDYLSDIIKKRCIISKNCNSL